MPELAEVEYYRTRWNDGLRQPIRSVAIHAGAKVFRGCDTDLLVGKLTGARLTASETAGKQMLFRCSGQSWLGIHLGMTGKLSVGAADHNPAKADHLVLVQDKHTLIFSDFRMFGLVRFDVGARPPRWWSEMAPPILSAKFTIAAVEDFLRRRKRAPIKAVLLMQEQFPGVGNWMADEILWRAAIHPRRASGSLAPKEIRALHRESRWVCRQAMRIIGRTFADPPDSWLFPHRWEKGGRCPKTGAKLVRETIGGRTTCWSPGRQFLR